MLNIQKIRSSLEGNGFISGVVYLEETGSTNSFAKQSEVKADSLIITDFQSEGKGRLDRKWFSEKGSNLTFSIKKNLPVSPAENNYAVFYFSYRLFEALQNYLAEYLSNNDINELEIKWPNDILFRGKKICGILIESVLPAGIYIIGIGVNCNQSQFPEEINASSLQQITGHKTDITSLLINIIENFSFNIEELESKKFNKIYLNWKNSTNMIGKRCAFTRLQADITNGKIIDLDEDGSIMIETAGKITKFHSGDIKITSFS